MTWNPYVLRPKHRQSTGGPHVAHRKDRGQATARGKGATVAWAANRCSDTEVEDEPYVHTVCFWPPMHLRYRTV